jgi:hypothetical protein
MVAGSFQAMGNCHELRLSVLKGCTTVTSAGDEPAYIAEDMSPMLRHYHPRSIIDILQYR